MKVDRSILANNDQSMGMIADPDKLEASIAHLANVIDSNDDVKLDKTGNLEGTWRGMNPSQVAEGINSQRIDTLDSTALKGAGERMEIVELTFPASGSVNNITATGNFVKAFSTPPTIMPANLTAVVGYATTLRYPYIHNITNTGFSVRINSTAGENFDAGTIKMKFIAIGK